MTYNYTPWDLEQVHIVEASGGKEFGLAVAALSIAKLAQLKASGSLPGDKNV
ncbi:hypothetical protein ABE485_22950 [Achromobacter spanius]|uniref:hypothetical protein n=1 Tax=Achromobacter spanius TaxID=217203 RepID=UPI0032096CB0